MDKDGVIPFINKRVKLVYKSSFNLVGVITDVYDTFLRFRTDQTASLISFDNIGEIVLL